MIDLHPGSSVVPRPRTALQVWSRPMCSPFLPWRIWRFPLRALSPAGSSWNLRRRYLLSPRCHPVCGLQKRAEMVREGNKEKEQRRKKSNRSKERKLTLKLFFRSLEVFLYAPARQWDGLKNGPHLGLVTQFFLEMQRGNEYNGATSRWVDDVATLVSPIDVVCRRNRLLGDIRKSRDHSAHNPPVRHGKSVIRTRKAGNLAKTLQELCINV